MMQLLYLPLISYPITMQALLKLAIWKKKGQLLHKPKFQKYVCVWNDFPFYNRPEINQEQCVLSNTFSSSFILSRDTRKTFNDSYLFIHKETFLLTIQSHLCHILSIQYSPSTMKMEISIVLYCIVLYNIFIV
jgi:hypothetical protein